MELGNEKVRLRHFTEESQKDLPKEEQVTETGQRKYSARGTELLWTSDVEAKKKVVDGAAAVSAGDVKFAFKKVREDIKAQRARAAGGPNPNQTINAAAVEEMKQSGYFRHVERKTQPSQFPSFPCSDCPTDA